MLETALGLLAGVGITLGFGACIIRAATKTGSQSAASPASDGPADELGQLHEAESDVEQVCRETQEAIIRRAMWRAIRPMGNDKTSE